MKGTEHFKRTIQSFLEQRAAEDELFAVNYRNPAKNIDDCITFVLTQVLYLQFFLINFIPYFRHNSLIFNSGILRNPIVVHRDIVEML